ncbi:MAG: hypothetical protein HYR73_03800 [Candidatus Eisenbacteria bacterium]|nr:hypothetical protein [Candidatus Eisenbacteria bacterium]
MNAPTSRYLACVLAAAALVMLPGKAAAVLDINDRGPLLDPGGYRMRITNAGILGNAFYNVGLSNDPSFEFPAHSGHECLNHAELWVGATDDLGHARVSGGPALEWRPTLDPEDRVRIARVGQLGVQRFIDDDGDGKIDEEILNGKDDDGDGEVDEDLGIIGQTVAAADYVDDRPEAVNYGYSTGETHQPWGLTVHQEAYGWATPGFDGVAGVRFVIANHSREILHGLEVGVLADLDSRALTDRGGHLNDRIVEQTWSQAISDGGSSTRYYGYPFGKSCVKTLSETVPVLTDGVENSGLPVVALMGLGHTTDGLALLANGSPYARAPGSVAFRYTLYSNSRPPGNGGVPTLDQGRYDAMAGLDPGTISDTRDDYQVLLSCGPFNFLRPGQSITLDIALMAAEGLDSLKVEAQNALYLYHGYRLDLLPDSTGTNARNWDVGRSGLNGHEACLEPPPGVSFLDDPDCNAKFDTLELNLPPRLQLYSSGHCVWTDADCDLCTGFGGKETIEPWLDPGTLPAPPNFRVTPGDHRVTIEWDNLPEIEIQAGLEGTPRSKFVGYRLYRLGDWRSRESLLPPLQNWALVHAYGFDQLNSEKLLSSITDTTIDYERILYERKHYPVGRYRDVDSTALNGFDYLYVVSTVMDFSYISRTGLPQLRRIESPIVAAFDQRVVPHRSALSTGNGVWVVPNPFRAHAGWDRPVVPGDPLTRHIDFMGLPRAQATIRIYTVAGDLVAQLQHDGSRGDGEASWDLISRNGQETESGIYLFTVESNLGREIGHFVVIR